MRGRRYRMALQREDPINDEHVPGRSPSSSRRSGHRFAVWKTHAGRRCSRARHGSREVAGIAADCAWRDNGHAMNAPHAARGWRCFSSRCTRLPIQDCRRSSEKSRRLTENSQRQSINNHRGTEAKRRRECFVAGLLGRPARASSDVETQGRRNPERLCVSASRRRAGAAARRRRSGTCRFDLRVSVSLCSKFL
jgi:hypothetical protein